MTSRTKTATRRCISRRWQAAWTYAASCWSAARLPMRARTTALPRPAAAAEKAEVREAIERHPRTLKAAQRAAARAAVAQVSPPVQRAGGTP